MFLTAVHDIRPSWLADVLHVFPVLSQHQIVKCQNKTHLKITYIIDNNFWSDFKLVRLAQTKCTRSLGLKVSHILLFCISGGAILRQFSNIPPKNNPERLGPWRYWAIYQPKLNPVVVLKACFIILKADMFLTFFLKKILLQRKWCGNFTILLSLHNLMCLQ